MCEYCGCKGVPAIGELMEEHVALLEEAHHVRRALGAGDRAGAAALLAEMADHLGRHVRREEAGMFAALRADGEFADEIAQLEGEHESIDAAVAGLDVDAPGFEERVGQLFDDLSEHIEREDLGIFPVSVVTLGASGWDVVDRAHEDSPSFLTHQPAAALAVATAPTSPPKEDPWKPSR